MLPTGVEVEIIKWVPNCLPVMMNAQLKKLYIIDILRNIYYKVIII